LIEYELQSLHSHLRRHVACLLVDFVCMVSHVGFSFRFRVCG
jgi:hypothetical protein